MSTNPCVTQGCTEELPSTSSQSRCSFHTLLKEAQDAITEMNAASRNIDKIITDLVGYAAGSRK